MTAPEKEHMKAKALLARHGDFLRVMPGIDLFFEDAIDVARRLPQKGQLVVYETQHGQRSGIVDSVRLKPRVDRARKAGDVDIAIVFEDGEEVPEERTAAPDSRAVMNGVIFTRGDEMVFVEMGIDGDNPGQIIVAPRALPLHMQAKLDLWNKTMTDYWLNLRETVGMFGQVSVASIEGDLFLDQIESLVVASDSEMEAAQRAHAAVGMKLAV